MKKIILLLWSLPIMVQAHPGHSHHDAFFSLMVMILVSAALSYWLWSYYKDE